MTTLIKWSTLLFVLAGVSACEAKLDPKVTSSNRSGAGGAPIVQPSSSSVLNRVFSSAQENLVWTVAEGTQKGFGMALAPDSFDPPLAVTAEIILEEKDLSAPVVNLTIDKTLSKPATITLPDAMFDRPGIAAGFYVQRSAEGAGKGEILSPAAHSGPREFKVEKSGRYEILPLPLLADFDLSEISDFIVAQEFDVSWRQKAPIPANHPDTTFHFGLYATPDCSGVPVFAQPVKNYPARITGAPEGAYYACLISDWHRLRHKKQAGTPKLITIDRTPPVIADLAIGLVTTESVTLSWSSSDVLSGLKSVQLYYSPTAPLNAAADILANGILVPVAAMDHQATVGGLGLGRTYHFNVRVEDHAGHVTIGMPVSTTVIPNQVLNVTGNLEIASPASGSPTFMGVINGKMLYSAASPMGRELFITDGTQAGTSLVKDINPGPGDSNPSYPGVFGSLLLFTADSGSTGQELWRSDGTATGTWMVKELEPGIVGSNPQAPMPFGGFAVFSATTSAAGMELWRTDGTEAGTYMVTDLCPGTCSGGFYVSNYLSQANILNGKLLYLGNDGTSGNELWSTDGTAVGTTLVKDINPGTGNSESVWYNMTQYSGSVYFSAYVVGIGTELWKSDGTTGGTSLVKDIYAGTQNGYPAYMVVTGGKLVFRAADGVNGTELWVSDGTTGGTTMLKDINPGAGISHPDWIAVAGGIAYFKADDGVNGNELWRSDGTLAGTYMVADMTPAGSSFIQGMYPFGNKMVFQNNALGLGQEFWITDGTAPGTFLLKDINPDHRNSSAIAGNVVDGKMYFSAGHDFYGTELWLTDGTPTGTHMAVDFYGGLSSTKKFVSDGIKGTFIAYDAVTGHEPWIIQQGGAALLKDVNPGSSSSLPTFMTMVPGVAGAAGKIFFDGFEPASGSELWSSDGTAAGTSMIKDTTPGTSGTPILGMRPFKNGIVFMAMDSNGREYWTSDGTDAGTSILKDIAPGGLSANITFYGIGFGPPEAPKFLLSAGPTWSKPEIYITDGTTANTLFLKDIWDDDPSSTPAAAGSKPTNYAAAGNHAYFQARSYLAGTELWRTDGTEVGTIMIKDLNPGALSSTPENIVAAGSLVYFAADDGTGKKFWQTDGTDAGTVLVRSASLETFIPPLSAVTMNGILYFSGGQLATGTELWRTDGTPAGTYIVKELVTGAGGGNPIDMQVYEDTLYFAASTDGGNVFELWGSDGAAAGTVLVPGFGGPIGHPPYILGAFGQPGAEDAPYELAVSCYKDGKRVIRNFRSR